MNIAGPYSVTTERSAIIDFLLDLRRYQVFSTCPFVFMIESAPGNSAGYIEFNLQLTGIQELGTCYFMRERPNGGIGVPKNEKISWAYGGTLRHCLEYKLLCYNKYLVVPRTTSAEKVKEQMTVQLRNYHIETVTNERGQQRHHIGAKLNGSNDDMLVALQTALWWMREFFSKEVYRKQKLDIESRSYKSFPIT